MSSNSDEYKHSGRSLYSGSKGIFEAHSRPSGIYKLLDYMQYQFNSLAVMRKIKKASANPPQTFPKDIEELEYKESRLSRYTGLMDVFEASVSGERRRLEIVLQRSVVNNLLAKSDSVLPPAVREGLRAAQRAPV